MATSLTPHTIYWHNMATSATPQTISCNKMATSATSHTISCHNMATSATPHTISCHNMANSATPHTISCHNMASFAKPQTISQSCVACQVLGQLSENHFKWCEKWQFPSLSTQCHFFLVRACQLASDLFKTQLFVCLSASLTKTVACSQSPTLLY